MELRPSVLATQARTLEAQIGLDARTDLATWQPDLDFDAEMERLATCFDRRAQVMAEVIDGL